MAREGTQLDVDEVRRVQLRVLSAFADHCEEQGLSYMLAYGTLLGAVRHGGYIPWDDDIDVMMPRSDYERLRANESVAGLRVGGAVSDDRWPYANVKIGDGSTVVRGDGPFESGIGVNIDVFPIDGVPAGRIRVPQRLVITVITMLLSLQGMAPRPGRSASKRAVLRAAVPLASVVPRTWLLVTLHRVAAMAGSAPAAGVLVGSYQWSVPVEAVHATSGIQFEGQRVRAPHDAAAVLSSNYGPDYMIPPPPDKRFSHHTYVAHWR